MIERPAQVNCAMALLWGSLAISCVPAIFRGSDLPSLPESVPWWFQHAIAAATFAITALLFYLVSRQHNWARILLLVLFVIGAALSIVTFSWPIEGDRLSFALYLLVAILQAVALYLLFTGSAAKWFRRGLEDGANAA
jgi:hypothetical protein